MILLGLDFETTGLEPKLDKVIEVGAVLYDWNEKKPIKIYSEFIEEPVPAEITKLTGITQAMVSSFGVESDKVCEDLKVMASFADYVVAHNAKFDKAFCPVDVNKPWICTRKDIPYTSDIKTRKLHYLASEHQFLNPFQHRAVFDVLTMFEVLKHYDLKEVIKRSKSPDVTLIALVSYAEKDLDRDAGFHWNPNHKVWEIEIKECDVKKFTKNLNFKWRIVT